MRITNQPEDFNMKSLWNKIAFDKKPIALDTKSKGNHKRSIRKQQDNAMKSIEFARESVTFDMKSNRNYRASIRNQ